MHDFDSSLNELEADDSLGEQEYESPFENDPGAGEMEFEQLLGNADGSAMRDAEEMELASELLSVSNDAELDQFLGKLFKKVARGVGGFFKKGVGRQLGGVLRGVAKAALPIAGGALGSVIAPGVGTALGAQLGGMAGNLFEVDMESLSPEEAEFETARRFVRLASSAVSNAASASGSNAPPTQIARNAVVAAARQHAPGMLQPKTGNGAVERRASGRWVRRGNVIVVLGA